MRERAQVTHDYTARARLDATLAQGACVWVIGELNADWARIVTQPKMFPKMYLSTTVPGSTAEVQHDNDEQSSEEVGLSANTSVTIIEEVDERFVRRSRTGRRHTPR